MIALIPGLGDTTAYLRPTSPPAKNSFAQVLAEVKTATGSSPAPAAEALPSGPARYEVQPGDNLSRIAKKLGYADPGALARANQLKNPDRLQVGQVLTLPETTGTAPSSPRKTEAAASARAAAPISRHQSGKWVTASWYGSQHHGRQMANGQPFDMLADTVAHRSLPMGTRLTLSNPQNGNAVKVQVTDRGPFVPGRDLDMSYGVARKLGVLQSGVAKLRMEEG